MGLSGADTEKVVSKLMNVPDENGFEAWRKLMTGKEPRTGNHQVAGMQALMNYTYEGGLENFEDNTEEFKQQVARFEHRFSAVVDDTVMQAVLKNNAPQEIRDKVELETYDSFASLEAALEGWVQQRLGKAVKKKKEKTPKADPMDVDAMWGKGGQGSTKLM